MPLLTESKCTCCGAPVNPNRGENGVLRCGYCGSMFTLTKPQTDPAALDSIRIGSHELDIGKFDDAYESFKKAAQIDNNEPEAYMGMAYAAHKVRYIRDEVNNCLQPICYEYENKQFTQDSNYIKATQLATPEQLAQYERNAADIDYIRKEFNKLRNSNLDYDCFICVKVTDDNTRGRTADYKTADDIYFHLRGKGYKPFFSEREIGNRTGADYEALILYALYASECMIVVCSNESYLQTPWVKNEYTRFLKLINDEEKESSAITVVFSGTPIERLPNRKGKLQGIDMRGIDPYGKITAFVEEHTPEAKARRERQQQRRIQEEEEKQRRLDEQAQRLQEIEGRITAINGTSTQSPQCDQLLKRAKQLAEVGDYKNSATYYNRVLDSDPENGEAWLGLFLAETQVPDITTLTDMAAHCDISKTDGIFNSKSLKSCIKFTTDDLQKTLTDILDFATAWAGCEIERQNDEFVLSRYTGNKTVIAIPHGITVINNRAFTDYTNLVSVTIPDSVKSICDNVFSSCVNLASITIPDSVTDIGEGAFSNCRSLTEVKLPCNLREIKKRVFYNCRNLKSVTLSNNVHFIDEYAFGECVSLTDITYGDTKKWWKSLYKRAYWCSGSGKFMVHCTDKDVKKSFFD